MFNIFYLVLFQSVLDASVTKGRLMCSTQCSLSENFLKWDISAKTRVLVFFSEKEVSIFCAISFHFSMFLQQENESYIYLSSPRLYETSRQVVGSTTPQPPYWVPLNSSQTYNMIIILGMKSNDWLIHTLTLSLTDMYLIYLLISISTKMIKLLHYSWKEKQAGQFLWRSNKAGFKPN